MPLHHQTAKNISSKKKTNERFELSACLSLGLNKLVSRLTRSSVEIIKYGAQNLPFSVKAGE